MVSAGDFIKGSTGEIRWSYLFSTILTAAALGVGAWITRTNLLIGRYIREFWAAITSGHVDYIAVTFGAFAELVPNLWEGAATDVPASPFAYAVVVGVVVVVAFFVGRIAKFGVNRING